MKTRVLHLMMYVLYWILILCCWPATEAKAALSMLNRIHVALIGDILTFKLSVFIPANHTEKIVCYHLKKTITWETEAKSDIVPSTKQVLRSIRISNISFSGHYKCCFAKQEVHFVVLVREKGYEEPRDVLGNDIIIQMCVSGILLIFSVVGSLYILKNYKKHHFSRDKKSEETEKNLNESDDAVMDEDVSSSSLYTALQHRPASIYDILHPEMTAHTEHKRKKKSEQKNCKAQEDEIFDSVYENV